MTTRVEFASDPDILAGFEAVHAPERLVEDDAVFAAAIYQQIEDRRAQTEDAEVLRRARSL